MRLRLLCAICLLMVSTSGVGVGRDFDNTDIYPAPNKMDFDKDWVYFAALNYTAYQYGKKVYEWYALDRATHAITLMDAPPDEKAKGMVALPKAIGNDSGSAEFFDLMTGDGDDYSSTVPGCYIHKTERASLKQGDKEIPYFKRFCTGAGAVEKSGALLLVAGRFNGEDADGPDDWVAVLDTAARREVDSLSFTATIIRVDPFTNHIWMIGPPGIMLLDASAKPLQRWYFYRSFDPVNHASKLLLSDVPRETDPFAAMAWDLGVTDVEGWYKAVQALPAATRQSVYLYQYFMGGVQFSDPKYPGLQTLTPFLLDPMLSHVDIHNREFRSICLCPDPRVDTLVKEMTGSTDPFISGSGKVCAELRDKVNAN